MSTVDIPGAQVPQSGHPAHDGAEFTLLFSSLPEYSEKDRQAC